MKQKVFLGYYCSKVDSKKVQKPENAGQWYPNCNTTNLAGTVKTESAFSALRKTDRLNWRGQNCK
jgi:hypothetical protein